MIFKKKNDVNVHFETNNWAVRKYSPIRPAKEFLPEKFKNLPPFLDKKEHMIDSIKTVKSCPGIKDYLSLGYIIPAWCDMEFYPTNDGQVLGRYSDPEYNHTLHYPGQIQNFLENTYKVNTPIKLDNPWLTWTAKGWSILYLPLYYHDGLNFEAVPGIIDHDLGVTKSPINIMLKEPKKTVIKQGDPLVQVIPIRREDIMAETSKISQTAVDRQYSIGKLFSMSFNGWAKYMKEKKNYKIINKDTELPE